MGGGESLIGLSFASEQLSLGDGCMGTLWVGAGGPGMTNLWSLEGWAWSASLVPPPAPETGWNTGLS